MSRSVGEDLSALIDAYISGSRSRSLLTLANKAGVGYTTVRRLAQQEQNPTPATSLLILRVIAEDEEIVAFAQKHWPDLGQLLERFLNNASCIDSSGKQSSLTMLWRKPVALEIFCYTSCVSGRSMADLKNRFGEQASLTIEWLIDNNFLMSKGDVFTSVDFFLSDFSSILEAMKSSISSLIQSNFEGAEIASWQVEGLNDEGAQLIKEAALEFVEKVEEIRSNSRYKGDLATVAGVYSRSLN